MPVTVTCANPACRRLFAVHPNKAGAAQYCSRECRDVMSRRQVVLICANCGRPFSVRPVPSTVVVQYAASCVTLTAGRFLAHAARRRMPLPGWPHFKVVLQPLTVVWIALIFRFIRTIAVRYASTPPMMTACTI